MSLVTAVISVEAFKYFDWTCNMNQGSSKVCLSVCVCLCVCVWPMNFYDTATAINTCFGLTLPEVVVGLSLPQTLISMMLQVLLVECSSSPVLGNNEVLPDIHLAKLQIRKTDYWNTHHAGPLKMDLKFSDVSSPYTHTHKKNMKILLALWHSTHFKAEKYYKRYCKRVVRFQTLLG